MVNDGSTGLLHGGVTPADDGYTKELLLFAGLGCVTPHGLSDWGCKPTFSWDLYKSWYDVTGGWVMVVTTLF